MFGIRPKHWAVLAIAAAALGYAAPVSGLGWNQGSHYALVESLDRGTARIDAYRWQTGDVAWVHGHFYSTKPPGLALAALPAYATLEGTGATQAISDRTGSKWRAAIVTIWVLHLWTVVLAAAILLLLVRWVADGIEPGLGAATALTLGLGTLVLPFSTVFFSHVLSACLGFAAFALLWRERRDGFRFELLLAAGLLAGLAMTVEYSLGIVTLALALYATVRRDRIPERAVAYVAGLALGVLPLVLYNRLGLGGFGHVSYADAVSRPGRSGHAVLGANSTGFFGVGLPSPRVAAELLFSARGILTLSPVLAMSVVGLVVLYRRGLRAEALTISFVALGYLVFNAGYFLPFGGATPGPRLLVPAIPFVVVTLAAAYRRYPGCTLGLAAASVAMLVTATATKPMLPNDDTSRWTALARAGSFRETVASFVGGRGVVMVLPFLLPIVAAFVFAVLATPGFRVARREARWAIVLLAVWALAATVLPRAAHAPGTGAIVLIVCAAGFGALAVAAALLARPEVTAAGAAAPRGSGVKGTESGVFTSR